MNIFLAYFGYKLYIKRIKKRSKSNRKLIDELNVKVKTGAEKCHFELIFYSTNVRHFIMITFSSILFELLKNNIVQCPVKYRN